MGWQSIRIVGASAPENPEDGKMYFLVLAYPGFLRHGPESHKMVIVVVVVDRHLVLVVFCPR